MTSIHPHTSLQLDLSPARWIWFPGRRTPPNTAFHFRKTVTMGTPPRSARGWILGESRYVLFCNGHRQQFGPTPCDPRYSEADPVDLTHLLVQGENVIGATVLFFGWGDGTWPTGKPGFIFWMEMEWPDGRCEQIVSDAGWSVEVARSWAPGKYKRWYLRALQEDFDARLYPYGWSEAGFAEDESWVPAQELSGSASATALSAGAPDYLNDSQAASVTHLFRRTTPLLTEVTVAPKRFVESHWLLWRQDPELCFDLGMDSGCIVTKGTTPSQFQDGSIGFDLQGDQRGCVLTWEFDEQVVGWPEFRLRAPSGTLIEIMVQGGHLPYPEGGPLLMDTAYHSWTRFRCREGNNEFITFDFESVKWLQVHCHGSTGHVRIFPPRIRRRLYPFRQEPVVRLSDPGLQLLMEATVNTIRNNSQETLVDCMGRERQQYSGDIGHLIHPLHQVFGDTLLSARFLRTFSQGQTKTGYFLDCWPAFDRIIRVSQRLLDLTPWGPLLDHGVGFVFDAYHHYLYSGNLEDLAVVYPRLIRFFRFLQSLVDADPLLPVEDLGTTQVWIDHDAYRKQAHKRLAFNLYAAAMLQDAFVPLCHAFGQRGLGEEAASFSQQLLKAVRKHYYCPEERLYIANLPSWKEDGGKRTCDRSLSHIILSNFGEKKDRETALRELALRPDRMGWSYPANAYWRILALIKGGRMDCVLDELRSDWTRMESVRCNHTLSEHWFVRRDTRSEWSHAAVAPLLAASMGLAGIAPLQPGGGRIRIWPQPGDIAQFETVYHTASGAVALAWAVKGSTRCFEINVPPAIQAELWLGSSLQVSLPAISQSPAPGLRAWSLPAGCTTFSLPLDALPRSS